MVKATPLYRDKASMPDGTIVEMSIWRLPAPSAERPHGLKYRLFYGRPGERIVGYDNETGKGDHRHVRNREDAYVFTTVDALVADFIADVRRERER